MTRNLKQQALINTVGNVTYLTAQFLLTVLTTRSLGYEAVGYLTLAMSVGNVFTFIQLYGVRSFQSSDVTGQYTSGDYLTARVVSIIAGLLLCGAFVLLMGYDRALGTSIVLFTLFRTSETLSDVLFGDIQRSGRLELVGICMFCRGILTVALFLTGLRAFHSLNLALLLIVAGSGCLTAVLDSTLYRQTVPWNPGSRSGCREILRSCFPLLLASLLPTLITSFPRILLERFNGAELLGFYGNISTPAVIITAVVPNVLASFMPLYGSMAEERNFKGVRRLWAMTVLGTLAMLSICLLGAAALAKPVLVFLYTEAIVPYVHYLYGFLVSTALYAITMCGSAALIALRKNRAVSVCAVCATGFCFLTAPWLIGTFRISGAIAVLMASYLVQTGLQAFVLFYEGANQ